MDAAGMASTGLELEPLFPPEMANFYLCGHDVHGLVFMSFKDRGSLWSWPGVLDMEQYIVLELHQK